MATAASMEEHFNCVMCFEVFQDPTTLHCQHTFCRLCLQRFVQAKVDLVQGRGIPCPVCRQTTPIPDPEKPVGDWVDQIKTNFFIANLMESLNPKEEDCHMCHLEGETTKATVWCIQCDSPFCKSCHRFHSKAPISKSHEVMEISSVSWESLQTRRQRFCEEHTDKYLELYCQDCDSLACSTCCTIKHRKCDNVASVGEAGKIKRSELKNQHDLLKTELERVNKKLQKETQMKENLLEQMKTIEISIRKETEQAIAELRKKESVLLQEVREKFDIEIQKISENIKTLDTLSKASDQNIRLSARLLTSLSDNDLLKQQKQDKRTIVCGENVDMSDSHSQIQFVSNMSAVMTTLKMLSLGEIFVNRPDVKNRRLDTRKKVDKDRQTDKTVINTKTDDDRQDPNLKDRRLDTRKKVDKDRQTDKTVINTKTEDDRQDPDLRDVTVMRVNHLEVIVVTDINNACVKCFYERNNKSCFSRLSLDSPPWSVTNLSENNIAVSLPYQCQICVISVTPELRHHSTIKTGDRKYYGLAAVNNTTLAVSTVWWRGMTLAVSTVWGRGRMTLADNVDIINLSGEVIRSISGVRSGVPHYLCVTHNTDIIVSDSTNKDVRCVTQTGEVKFRCSGQLQNPQGVSRDRSGCIFVADRQKVIKISADGNFIVDIMTSQDGLKSPRSVCFYDDHLYIVHNGGEIIVLRLN